MDFYGRHTRAPSLRVAAVAAVTAFVSLPQLSAVPETAAVWAGAGGSVTGSAVPGPGGVTSRVSVGPGGVQANGVSSRNSRPSISAGGRYVAFASEASNLVAGDTNDSSDVFVRDRVAHVTRRVSVGPGGAQAHGMSFWPSISADGRYVAFTSRASNLVVGDTNDSSDVFVWDRVDRTTLRVSVAPGGAQGNDVSSTPSISADGRYVAFASRASNLVAGDTNGEYDVFVRDRVANVTERVSVGPGGAQADLANYPTISADGRYVVFESESSNLVAGDPTRRWTVFVRDRVAQVTERVSVGPGGAQGNNVSFGASISADGRYVAFTSRASNLVARDTNRRDDVFVRDRVAKVTRRVSVGSGGAQGNRRSISAAISANGRHVAFASRASNLVAGDTNKSYDVFVRDRVSRVTLRVSVGRRGADANDNSSLPSIAGRHVAFGSVASNLVAGDTNEKRDVFVRDLAD